MDCDVYVRKSYAECRLVRGTAMFQEVFERMTKELTASAPSAMKTKWFAPTDGTITAGTKRFRFAEVLFQPCVQQPTILSARTSASMSCRSAELTAASPSAMKINVPAEVQQAPPVDAPNASVCGSVRGGSHTVRSGRKPHTPRL